MDQLENEIDSDEFVDQVFATFSWRTLPQTIWDESNYDYRYYKDGFDPVPPKEFDLLVFKSHPFHGQGDRLCFMTVEGYLYYLPAFIALLLSKDANRLNDLGDALLGTMRSFPPYIGPIRDWVSYVSELPPLSESPREMEQIPEEMEEFMLHLDIENLTDWFVHKVSSSQCENIAAMTDREREIVAQFLDRYEKLKDSPHTGIVEEANKFHSLRSILRNGSYSSRLGAKNEVDIADLLLLLDIAHQKYPGSFPNHLVESIQRKLGRAGSKLNCIINPLRD